MEVVKTRQRRQSVSIQAGKCKHATKTIEPLAVNFYLKTEVLFAQRQSFPNQAVLADICAFYEPLTVERIGRMCPCDAAACRGKLLIILHSFWRNTRFDRPEFGACWYHTHQMDKVATTIEKRVSIHQIVYWLLKLLLHSELKRSVCQFFYSNGNQAWCCSNKDRIDQNFSICVR